MTSVLFVTYGNGYQQAQNFSRVEAESFEACMAEIARVTEGAYAFSYTEDQFQGQPEKYGLTEIPLQKQTRAQQPTQADPQLLASDETPETTRKARIEARKAAFRRHIEDTRAEAEALAADYEIESQNDNSWESPHWETLLQALELCELRRITRIHELNAM